MSKKVEDLLEYSYHTKADRRSTFYTAKLPDLQDVQVEKVENFEEKQQIYIKPERKVVNCPCCHEERRLTVILNSFDSPFINGFTEGCNNKIKVLKRKAYGYRRFDRFRN